MIVIETISLCCNENKLRSQSGFKSPCDTCYVRLFENLSQYLTA